jgi:hypothetical protein
MQAGREEVGDTMPTRIPLTQGYVALVDDADAERVSQHRWYPAVHKAKHTVYAWTRINGIYTRMHHFILETRQQTDHRDGDGLNNQRSNLRPATCAQNQQNKYNPRGSSRFKGVSWHKAARKWRVCISANRKAYRFGLFDSELDAARAYNEAARVLHGEFARLNDVPEPATCTN